MNRPEEHSGAARLLAALDAADEQQDGQDQGPRTDLRPSVERVLARLRSRGLLNGPGDQADQEELAAELSDAALEQVLYRWRADLLAPASRGLTSTETVSIDSPDAFRLVTGRDRRAYEQAPSLIVRLQPEVEEPRRDEVGAHVLVSVTLLVPDLVSDRRLAVVVQIGGHTVRVPLGEPVAGIGGSSALTGQGRVPLPGDSDHLGAGVELPAVTELQLVEWYADHGPRDGDASI